MMAEMTGSDGDGKERGNSRNKERQVAESTWWVVLEDWYAASIAALLRNRLGDERRKAVKDRSSE
jgi:hypothetical protein